MKVSTWSCSIAPFRTSRPSIHKQFAWLRVEWKLIFVSRVQDLYGSAAPAVEGDELDVTKSSKPKPVSEDTVSSKLKTEKIIGAAAITGDEGLSSMQKLFFFGIIVGACAIFIRTRPGKGGTREKSMA